LTRVTRWAFGPRTLRHERTPRNDQCGHIAIYRIEDGRIAEAWAEWDTLSGLAQLGHIAPTE